jgi:hypothetical protein
MSVTLVKYFFHDTLAERCAAAGRDDPVFVVPLALGYAEKRDQQHAMLAVLDEQIAPNSADALDAGRNSALSTQ